MEEGRIKCLETRSQGTASEGKLEPSGKKFQGADFSSVYGIIFLPKLPKQNVLP